MRRLLLTAALALTAAALFAQAAQAAPAVSATCNPAPATCRGWYVEPVAIQWDWLPTTASVLAGCVDRDIDFDTNGHVEFCEVSDGQSTIVQIPMHVDMTAPLLTGASAARPPDASGWYRTPVGVNFAGSDATSGLLGCTRTTYVGPDSGTARVTGVCRDIAGNESAVSTFNLKYDGTPPSIATATPNRRPDHGSWYTRPVGFAVAASDRVSGLAGCDPLAYGGRASAAATVTAVCRDFAGNTGAREFTFPYDDEKPALGKVRIRPGDRVVRLDWSAAEASDVRIARLPGRNGEERTVLHDGAGTTLVDRRVRNGRKYEYRFSAVDPAGNEAARSVFTVPGPRLLSPEPRARLTRPPVLRWTPVRDAEYYNVQLFRGDRKVLSAWPTRARLRLRRVWQYLGERERLVPGRYRWLVWPGEGPRELNVYGTKIGARTFVIARST